RATASGLAGSPVIFTATATAGAAATIAANSRTSQPGPAGAALRTPPIGSAQDANGDPVPGGAVSFSATGANGTVNPATPVTTDGSVVAPAASSTLGPYTPLFRSRATASGLAGSPVIFTATATAGAAATMAKSSGDNLTGQVATHLQTPHIVLVRDANGNPVVGVTVTWAAASGGGSVDPATSTTDAKGHAQTFRTLGILIGTQ